MDLRTTRRGAEAWPSEHEMEVYAHMSLSGLAERIVAEADARALAELHRRALFAVGEEGPVTLTGLVSHLRQKAQRRGTALADRAYDLTIDKFCRLPERPTGTQAPEGTPAPERQAGPDCRAYFRAFLQYLEERRQQTDRLSDLARELFEARALRGLVRRHFRLALLEARRTGEWTRYVWHLPDGDLSVLMPRPIVGRERRQWLEEHITEVDASRDGERDRVQAIIDAEFRSPVAIRPWYPEYDHADAFLGSPPPVPGEELFDVSRAGLAETVAREKAANIDAQRPAIRSLGPERLAEMILKILDGIAQEGFELARIAEEYGVSKPTMTRFAGTRWTDGGPPRAAAVPDLWRNTARVLGSDPDFVEAARQARVWRRVEEARDEL